MSPDSQTHAKVSLIWSLTRVERVDEPAESKKEAAIIYFPFRESENKDEDNPSVSQKESKNDPNQKGSSKGEAPQKLARSLFTEMNAESREFSHPPPNSTFRTNCNLEKPLYFGRDSLLPPSQYISSVLVSRRQFCVRFVGKTQLTEEDQQTHGISSPRLALQHFGRNKTYVNGKEVPTLDSSESHPDPDFLLLRPGDVITLVTPDNLSSTPRVYERLRELPTFEVRFEATSHVRMFSLPNLLKKESTSPVCTPRATQKLSLPSLKVSEASHRDTPQPARFRSRGEDTRLGGGGGGTPSPLLVPTEGGGAGYLEMTPSHMASDSSQGLTEERVLKIPHEEENESSRLSISTPMEKSYTWLWKSQLRIRDDNLNAWSTYPDEVSSYIEKKFALGMDEARLAATGYTIAFEDADVGTVQFRNTDWRRWRPVIRVLTSDLPQNRSRSLSKDQSIFVFLSKEIWSQQHWRRCLQHDHLPRVRRFCQIAPTDDLSPVSPSGTPGREEVDFFFEGTNLLASRNLTPLNSLSIPL